MVVLRAANDIWAPYHPETRKLPGCQMLSGCTHKITTYITPLFCYLLLLLPLPGAAAAAVCPQHDEEQCAAG
jgi:hypothetical protein